MGTPAFAVPSLEACLELGEVILALTQPDRPSGRGQKLLAPPVKLRALERGIPVRQPERLKGLGLGQELTALGVDVCVVTAYGRILPKDVLEAPRCGCVNVHASLLPRWRGAAPIQWAVAAGDAETGVTLMRLDEGLDTGSTFAQAKTPISPDDTSETLHVRLAELGGRLLEETLPEYLSGKRVPVPQPTVGITHAPKIEKAHGALDFSLPASTLERRIRAFAPWPGTWTFVGSQLLKVKHAKPVAGSGKPGTLLASDAETLDVACGEGVLRLTRVQPEGRREMSIGEFLRGKPLRVGETPFSNHPAP
ncbi:MAG: methionyl-tRNA formyltransferase [Myxococcaceae bacterium]